MTEPRPDILIIEDDEDIRHSLQELLEMEGYGIATARNGQVALDAVTAGMRPKLFLVDHRMPLVDGPQFLASKQNDKRIAEAPAIFLTASRISETPQGAVAYLTKPLDLEALLKLIRTYLH